MMTPQNGGPCGLGGAVAGAGRGLVLMKRGQNVYQSYMLVFPRTGQGIVVMTDSDNGTTLATALIRRAAAVYGAGAREARGLSSASLGYPLCVKLA